MFKKIRDLRKGDQILNRDGTVAYTILETWIDHDGLNWVADVQWFDGGRSQRAWYINQLDEKILVAA